MLQDIGRVSCAAADTKMPMKSILSLSRMRCITPPKKAGRKPRLS